MILNSDPGALTPKRDSENMPTDCRSVRLRSRFLLNSFWRQLRTHYKARTEALCESIEKSPIDVNGSKARGTFVAQFVGDRLAVQWSVIRKASPALASGQHLSLSASGFIASRWASMSSFVSTSPNRT